MNQTSLSLLSLFHLRTDIFAETDKCYGTRIFAAKINIEVVPHQVENSIFESDWLKEFDI